MKKFIGFVMITLMMATGVLFLAPDESQAVPAFARQTGQACQSCHFQEFPMLNAFGRSFKAGGFTMVGGESLISGDVLSLPSVLNMSLVAKVRFQKTDGSSGLGTDKGELQFPDEAALLIGGRVGENIGFLLESALKAGDDPFASFKMPIVFEVGGARLLLIPFTTDSLGVSYGFELLNTGAVRNVRALEDRRQNVSAQQYIGTDGPAEGVAVVLHHDLGYINISGWEPAHVYAAGVHSLATYIRAALTQTVGGWDVAGGIQWWGGTAKADVGGAIAVDNPVKAWALDAQAQGQVGNMPLGLYLSYANAKKTNAGDTPNIFNSMPNDKTAFAIAAKLGVIPNRASLTLGYRIGKTGASTNDSDNGLSIAAGYAVTQNVRLELDYSHASGSANDSADSKNRTTVMLFSAF